MNKEEMEQTVSTYNSYLDRMETALQHFCEDLQESGFKEVGPVMTAVIDGLEWLTEAADSLSKLGKVETQRLASFMTIIGNIKDSMENKDYVLLHDLVEFELVPLLGGLKVTDDQIH